MSVMWQIDGTITSDKGQGERGSATSFIVESFEHERPVFVYRESEVHGRRWNKCRCYGDDGRYDSQLHCDSLTSWVVSTNICSSGALSSNATTGAATVIAMCTCCIARLDIRTCLLILQPNRRGHCTSSVFLLSLMHCRYLRQSSVQSFLSCAAAGAVSTIIWKKNRWNSYGWIFMTFGE